MVVCDSSPDRLRASESLVLRTVTITAHSTITMFQTPFYIHTYKLFNPTTLRLGTSTTPTLYMRKHRAVTCPRSHSQLQSQDSGLGSLAPQSTPLTPTSDVSSLLVKGQRANILGFGGQTASVTMPQPRSCSTKAATDHS